MIAPFVIQATPAAWGGKEADVREIMAPGVSEPGGIREARLRLSTRKRTLSVSRSQNGPRPVIGRRNIAYSSGMLLHVQPRDPRGEGYR